MSTLASEPRPAPVPVFANKQRLPYLDNLRILLTALVIYHHTVIAYGGLGGWLYITPDTVTGWPRTLLSATLSVNQAFFMSLFFFVSAYLMPASLERKGTGRFVADRLVRLGIPLALMTFVIFPALVYAVETLRHGNTLALLPFMGMFISRHVTTAHMWFVLSLMLFEGAYLLYRLLPWRVSRVVPDRFPGPLAMIGFMLVSGLAAFGIRQWWMVGENIIALQFGFFALYMTMYAAGLLAYRKQWLDCVSVKRALPYFIAALALIPFIVAALAQSYKDPAVLADVVGGPHLQALGYALWEPVICVGFSFFLLAAFKRWLNGSNSFTRRLAADSYAVYFLHPVVVVGLTLAFESVPLAPLPKFGLVCALSVAACFAIADLLRRIPGVKRVL